MKDCGSFRRMEMRAPVSRMERAVCRVDGGVEGEGIRAFECRRASLALEREVDALEGSVCRACWRVWRRVGRSVVGGSDGTADGMLV